MLIVTIAEKECKGISKRVEEDLHEVPQELKFEGWIDVNLAKRRDLCSIFVMETHNLRKSKSYQQQTHMPTSDCYEYMGCSGRERECAGLNLGYDKVFIQRRFTFQKGRQIINILANKYIFGSYYCSEKQSKTRWKCQEGMPFQVWW